VTEYQDFVVDILYFIFSNYTVERIESDKGRPILKTIRNHFIRSYNEYNSDGAHIWQKIKLYKEHMKWSKRAFNAYNEAIKKGNKDIVDELHFEHLTPCSQIYKALIEKANGITKEDIAKILNDSEIVILSKEEARLLDGTSKRKYQLETEMLEGLDLKSEGTPKQRLAKLGITELKTFCEWENG
jgi:hypothetical protein